MGVGGADFSTLLIGAAGGLAGALLTNTLQYVREHHHWLKNQRLQVYSEFHRAARDLYDAANALFRDIRDTPALYAMGIYVAGPPNAVERVAAAADRVLKEMDRVELLGSEELLAIAHELWEPAHDLRSRTTLPDRFDAAAFRAEWDGEDVAIVYGFEDAAERFLAAARREVGSRSRIADARERVRRLWQRRTRENTPDNSRRVA